MLNLFQHLKETLKRVQGDSVDVLAVRVAMPHSCVMLNLFQHLKETLKRVQGDGMDVLAVRMAMPFLCHAELVSASGDPEPSSG